MPGPPWTTSGGSGLAGDEAVLIGLDRGDDVAHPAFARMVELLQEEVLDARDRVLERAVERFVAQVEEPTALRAEAAAERDAVRVVGRRRVERPRSRSLPVDDERLRIVVVHPAPPHVDGGVVAVDVDAAEAETAFRVGQRLQSADAPALDRLRCDLGRRGRRRALDRRPRALERGVGVVDVGLLGRELGVRHGSSVLAVREREPCARWPLRGRRFRGSAGSP